LIGGLLGLTGKLDSEVEEEDDSTKQSKALRAKGVQTPFDKAVIERKAAYIDVSSESGRPLEYGKETLLINSSIMSRRYQPVQAGWIVDLDLPTEQT
jgi:hypothetical protein